MDHVPNEKGHTSRHVEDLQGAVKDEMFDPEVQMREALHNEIDLDNEVVKKLIRKIDYRLIPPLAFLYAIALVDRNNLPNARLAGLDEELDISKGNRYSLLVMMFFIPYILFELPANLAMRKVGPAKWLGAIGFAWGIVTIGMGFVHSWGALLGCRVLFGIFEAGLFPGSIYLMSCWYKRYEVQKRCVHVSSSSMEQTAYGRTDSAHSSASACSAVEHLAFWLMESSRCRASLASWDGDGSSSLRV